MRSLIIDSNRESQRSCLAVALFALVYFILRSRYFYYVQIWDSRLYYESLLSAQANPFDILNYTGGIYGGHNSQLWIFLAGIPNYFFPYSYYAYNVWIALLGTGSVIAFYGIVTELSAKSLSLSERLLITALFAFQPSIFANQVHITTDTGLLMFWIWFLLALLKEKTAIASVAGCFLLFSKEPALAYLPIVFIFCALRQPYARRLQWIKKYQIVIFPPFSLMILYLFYKVAFRQEPLFFGGFLQKSTEAFHIYPDATLINYVLMALVANFNWMITGLTVFFSVQLYTKPKTDYWVLYKQQALAIIWLLLATACVVFGVRSNYLNARYLLPVFTVMILCFAYVMPAISQKNLRVSLLMIVLALFGWQNFRSIDPIGNSVFCTTWFGKHRMLSIPDFNRVCALNEVTSSLPGDRLVYNLEFLHFPLLIDAMMSDIRPENNTVFVLEEPYSYKLFGQLDKDYRFAYANAQTAPIFNIIPSMGKIYDEQDRLYTKALPDTLYYIEFSAGESKPSIAYLLSHYSGTTQKIYDNDGYEITVVKFYHKNHGDWCEPV